MNINNENKIKLINRTFKELMAIKRETGTILFFFKLLDKKNNKLVDIRETILLNIEKNLECLNFIFLNLNKVNSSTMVDCIIGVDSLTGMTLHLEKRMSLSIEYLIADKIFVSKKLKKIKGNDEIKEIFSEIIVGYNSEKTNYYCFNNKESLAVIWNLQELILVRKLATFCKIKKKLLPFIKEQLHFDKYSFINLINCFLINNDLVVKDGFILKKNFNYIWEPISSVDYIRKNIRSILKKMKAEYPGQLYEININDVVLKMAKSVFYEIYKYPDLLIAPEEPIPTHVKDRLLLEIKYIIE